MFRASLLSPSNSRSARNTVPCACRVFSARPRRPGSLSYRSVNSPRIKPPNEGATVCICAPVVANIRSNNGSVGLPLYRSRARWIFYKSALIKSHKKRWQVVLLWSKVRPFVTSRFFVFFSRDGKTTGDSPPRYTVSSSRNELETSSTSASGASRNEATFRLSEASKACSFTNFPFA